MIVPASLPSLMAAMSSIADPRHRRGVRHPFASILALALVGLVSRINNFAGLQRWAARHWHLLRKPLGFIRHRPPHATTLSRTLARFSLQEFQAAFSQWLQVVVSQQGSLAVSVDGKTSKQGLDAEGDPIQMLNVFAQDLKACLGQWPLDGDKSTEPEVLKAHLSELFEKYPALRLITGDALFAQRNLAELTWPRDTITCSRLKPTSRISSTQPKAALRKRKPASPMLKRRRKKGAPRESFSLGRPGQRRLCLPPVGSCRLPHALASRSGDERQKGHHDAGNTLFCHQPRSQHHDAQAIAQIRAQPLAGGKLPALCQRPLVGRRSALE